MILVDTNILLRIIQDGHTHRPVALDAMERLTLQRGEQFSICAQSLFEMYVVCTRPLANNGLGMNSSQANAELVAARSVFELLPDVPQVYSIWEGLVAKHDVHGKRAHDVRLVSLMIHHRVPTLLSFNDSDFRSFSEIQCLNPFDVLSVSRI